MMSITVELSPEIETVLAALATAHGLDLPRYARRVLEEQGPGNGAPRLSLAERGAVWRDVADLPIRPPLSDQAIGRLSIHDARG